MFVKRIAMLLAFVFVATLVGVRPAAAGDKRTPFELNLQTFNPVYYDPGVVTTPGGNVHQRGPTWVADFETTDPRFQGRITIVDSIFEVRRSTTPFSGPANGVWTVDTNKDGQPEWEGRKHWMPQPNPTVIRYEGHGLGLYEGLRVDFVDTFDVTTGVETVGGEIFDPNSQ